MKPEITIKRRPPSKYLEYNSSDYDKWKALVDIPKP
jgi:hypothetical protein